jgi:hypothetical protein
MRTRSTLLVALVLALAVAPAQAIAAPQDVATTHTYIEANYSLAQAMVARTGAGQRKVEALNTSLAHECPGIGTGSIENEASQPISHEVVVALWSLEFGVSAGPIRSFQKTVGGLRWSNSATTRAAARYVRSLHELSTLPLPNICADVRTWKASGFQVVPAAVVSLVRRVEAIEPNAIPSRLLAPYERGGDAGLLKRTVRLEQRLEENEFRLGQDDWARVLETLALSE